MPKKHTKYSLFGLDPALFRSTATNPDNIQWIASTYLSASKNLIVSREICIILDTQWGYSITNGTIVHVEMKTLKLEGELFLRDLAILHMDYPRWRFSICAEQDGFND